MKATAVIAGLITFWIVAQGFSSEFSLERPLSNIGFTKKLIDNKQRTEEFKERLLRVQR